MKEQELYNTEKRTLEKQHHEDRTQKTNTSKDARKTRMNEYLIKTYTQEGMTVLDNCMGSGTTGVACLNTGRDFIGIELDEHYFDIARQRIGARNT